MKFRSFLSHILSLFSYVLLWSAPLYEKTAFSTPTSFSNAQISKIEKVFEESLDQFLTERGFSGGIVVVLKGDQLLAKKGIGTCSNPDQICPLASLTKLFSCIAIWDLIDQQKLSLYTNVYQYLDLPYAPVDKRFHRLLVKDLLEHRGGWDRDLSDDPLFDYQGNLQLSPAALQNPDVFMEQVLTQVSLDFAPGDRYAYANFGYFLLGKIIEKASGVDYLTYINERIASPHGFTLMQAVQPTVFPREILYPDCWPLHVALSSYGLAGRLEEIGRYLNEVDWTGELKKEKNALDQWYRDGSLPGLTALIRQRFNHVMMLVYIPDRDENNAREDTMDLKKILDHAASRCGL